MQQRLPKMIYAIPRSTILTLTFLVSSTVVSAQDAPWFWKGTFRASYENGDLILTSDVPEAPKSAGFRAYSPERKTESVLGKFAITVNGKQIEREEKYIVAEKAVAFRDATVHGKLKNPLILVVEFVENGAPSYKKIRDAQRIADLYGNDSVEAFFVYREVDAVRLLVEIANRQKAQESPLSNRPRFIVVSGATQNYKTPRARTVKKISEQDGKYIVEFSAWVPTQKNRLKRQDIRLTDPQLLMRVTPANRHKGPAFAPVPLSSEILPKGSKFILVNSQQEAVEAYFLIMDAMENQFPMDPNGFEPFTLKFLVDNSGTDNMK